MAGVQQKLKDRKTKYIREMIEKCPQCGSDLKYSRKSSEHTAKGHHARVFECNNPHCSRETVLGGWANT